MLEKQAANVLHEDGPEEVATTEHHAEELSDAQADQAGEVTDPQAEPNKGEPTEEQKQKKLGGWQRARLKAERERDFWREEALRSRTAKPDEAKPAAAVPRDEEQEPKLTPMSSFSGTMQEYDAMVAEFPAKHAKYLESKRARDEAQREHEGALATLNARMAELPELGEIQKAVKEHSVPPRLTNFMISEAAKKTNGAEVLREALLDEGTRDELLALDRHKDAAGISALLTSIAHALRIAAKKAAPAGGTPAAETRAPKPPSTVEKAGGRHGADIYDDKLPYKDFVKARETQKKG